MWSSAVVGALARTVELRRWFLERKAKITLSEAELIELKEVIKDQSMAVAFLLGANLLRYENLSKIWRMITYRGATMTQPFCQPPIIYLSIENRIPDFLVSTRRALLAMTCHSTLLMEAIHCCSIMEKGENRKEKLMWPPMNAGQRATTPMNVMKRSYHQQHQ